MKKLIICLIVAIILSNCDIGVRKSNAQNKLPTFVGAYEYYVGNMKYIMFYGSGMFVVNVTRDSLQCEIIKANLKKIQNGKD